ncbi:hypothetical protein ABZ477_11860 [Microbacterium sp. NPDC019599]|uniref:hypothetical protein n=1 Tax=Microbacterium sp. NPDC019599 TaxID=3154690 RepID=UPI00340E068A
MPPAVPPAPDEGSSTRHTARQLRALRGVTATAVTTVLAATAHTLAGGGAPAPLLVAAVILLAAPVGVALAGRRLALWRLVLIVAASQVVFHMAFAVTAGARPASALGHAHHEVIVLDASASTGAVDPLMLAAHLGAAVVAVAALHRGERMLSALAHAILSLIALRFAVPRGSFPGLPEPVADAGRSIRPSSFVSDLSGRGPPVTAAAR